MRETADPRNLIWFVPAKGVRERYLRLALRRSARAQVTSFSQLQDGVLTVLVVVDGVVSAGPALSRVLRPPGDGDTRIVIGADGGALVAEGLRLVPDFVFGDLDSLDARDVARLEASGVPFRTSRREKDESDTELAVREGLAAGADEIVILGALAGPRVEHLLANVALLALPELGDCPVSLVDGPSAIWMVGRPEGRGSTSVAGSPGDYVSLLPMDPAVEGITTSSMRYPLKGESMSLGSTRGLSNELTEPEASVTTERGRLLVVHTARSVVAGDGETPLENARG